MLVKKSLGILVAAASMFAFQTTAWAQAKIDFALYEGKPVIKTGEGGSKITKHGIDFWTMGEPPRRFQLIGVVQDKRDEQMDGGHAVGSPSIASKVKAAGGDAVIVQSQEEAGKGAGFGTANNLFGFLLSGGSKTVTKMLVVKYLPDEESKPLPTATP